MPVHIVPNPIMNKLGLSSKLNAEWDFLSMLRDQGRLSAEAFLMACGDKIGKRSTLDIDQLLEGV